MDRVAWSTTVHGVTKSQTQVSDFTFTFLSENISKISEGKAQEGNLFDIRKHKLFGHQSWPIVE